MCVFVLTKGKYRYHALKKPYPTEVQIDSDFGYVDVGSVVVQNDYIFVQVKLFCRCDMLYADVVQFSLSSPSVSRFRRKKLIIIIITDLYSAYRSEDTEALDS